MRITAHLEGAGREVGSWAVTAALVLGLLGLVVDAGLLIAVGAPISVVCGGALAAAGLGALVGVCVAVVPALVSVASRRVGQARPGLWRGLFAASIALAPTWWIADPLSRRTPLAYVVFVVVTAALVGVAGWFAQRRAPVTVRVAAGVLMVAALAIDIALSTTLYLEIHDLAYLIGVAGALAMATDVRHWLRLARGRVLVGAVVAAVVVPGAAVLAVDGLVPGWRAPATHHGRHATRLARAIRAGVDFDGDGYSPVAWGGDCDDGDASRHPGAIDAPGDGDRNCNGVDPPAHAPPSAYGLAPPRGKPALAPGALDLVLFITVDTVRHDVLTPDLMPATFAFAGQGALFERAYAAGSRTLVSMPLMNRVNDGTPFVARMLIDAGIDARAIISLGFAPAIIGFDRATLLHKKDATKTTDAVIDALQSRAGSERGPALLAVHYFDPHLPWRKHREVGVPAVREELAPAYRSELAYTDRALGRLFDYLRDSGALERTAVILVGDHGEGMGEHGMHGHARSGWDTVVRVPAVLVAPGIRPGRYPQLVSQRDLPATLLGAFGLAAASEDAEVFGRSWWRLVDAPDAALHEFVAVRSHRFSSGRESQVRLSVMVGDRYKLIVSLEDQLRELFDLRADPRELRDRASDLPEVVDAMWRRLALYVDLDGG